MYFLLCCHLNGQLIINSFLRWTWYFWVNFSKYNIAQLVHTGVTKWCLSHNLMLSFLNTINSCPIVYSTNLYWPISVLLYDIKTSWTLVFHDVLTEHKDAFVVAKGNSLIRACILKTIKDNIVNSEIVTDLYIMFSKKNIQVAI